MLDVSIKIEQLRNGLKNRQIELRNVVVEKELELEKAQSELTMIEGSFKILEIFEKSLLENKETKKQKEKMKKSEKNEQDKVENKE